MKASELAVLLNVSQAQIAKVLREEMPWPGNVVPVSRYQLYSWAREMRQAEMWIREWAREG